LFLTGNSDTGILLGERGALQQVGISCAMPDGSGP